MKKLIVLVAVFGFILLSCNKEEVKKVENMNPFFMEKWGTPFETPDFSKVKIEDYRPAFDEGMIQHNKEIAAIADNTEEPTFQNTIDALEISGDLLTKTASVFYNLSSADTNEEIQKIQKEMAPIMSKHNDEILLNDKLFARIKAIHEKKESLNLTDEQKVVLEQYYKDFVRGGIDLPADKKNELMEINSELASLTTKFGENVLAETNAFELIIENKDDLAGLPEGVISAAKETAEQKGHKDKWVFTIQKPSLIPFLTYSEKRDLREKMLMAYAHKGDNNNLNDNKKVLTKIASLRVKRANLLGYKTHADYVLEESMAKNPKNVYDMLNKLWKPSINAAKAEAQELQKLIKKDGKKFKLQPWDWWYYSEKLKKAKYDLDEEELKPYFKLENVRQGAFDTANKLYGITFTERNDIPVYNQDVNVFEVKEADGSHIGILYVDYFPRASKRGGAWMNAYRKQYKLNGKNITPIICNVGNFTKPTGDKPSLLTVDEVQTLFHEFGHALHGLLSNCAYRKVSGTDVPRDFVEMPSQIMENWALNAEVLKMYAKHYKTGEAMPDSLIKKIENASHFNQGFATTEYLAASLLDMDWHTLTTTDEQDATTFENNSLQKMGLIPEIIVRYRSPYFSHIFSGGYSSGYYSYTWAAVLDADAFAAFEENGIFDQKTAKSFRNNILSKGGSEDAMELYRKFRGRDPETTPLLKRKGFIK